MIGQRFGKLTAVERAEDYYYKNGRHDLQYKCRCDCGNTVTVLGIHLRSGHTQSCGCYRADTTKQTMQTHGMTNTRLYTIWKNMRERCLNPKRPDYHCYGGRGIAICKEWYDDFSNFAEWANSNGYHDELSLDRIDVEHGYAPENCRWVTQKTQCNNTRRNINVTWNGQTHTLKQWTEILGINYGTISSRVLRGWDPIKALSTPVRSIAEHH